MPPTDPRETASIPSLPADAAGLQAQLLDAVGEAVIATDLEGRVIHWNRAAETMYGWPREEALGRPVLELTPAPDAEEDARDIMTRLEAGETWAGEFRVRRRDGTVFPALVTSSPIRDAAGDLVGVVGVSRDITARKAAEAAREAERERLQTVFTRAPALIAVLRGPDHVFEMANPRYAAGAGSRDLLGRPVREALPELADQGYVDLLDEVRRAGVAYEGVEAPVTSGPEGETRFYNFVYEPLPAGADGIDRIFFHGVDVTELVRARTAAEAASRAKSDFLAVMSHEFRTPLNAILGYSSLLEAGVPEPLPEGPRERVGRIRLAARHLRGLIDEVLSLVGLESGRLEVDARRVAIEEVLEQVRAVAEPLAVEKGLAFEAVVEDAPTHVVTDRGKLRQILLNLVGNAVKFTPEGRVVLSVGREGDRIVWRVSDTGIGIPDDQRESLFEPFWQADASTTRASGGTGLGLAISRRMARLLSGDVTVESEPGRGSVFTLRLPVAPPDAEAPPP